MLETPWVDFQRSRDSSWNAPPCSPALIYSRGNRIGQGGRYLPGSAGLSLGAPLNGSGRVAGASPMRRTGRRVCYSAGGVIYAADPRLSPPDSGDA
jgi:hypothetical protein